MSHLDSNKVGREKYEKARDRFVKELHEKLRAATDHQVEIASDTLIKIDGEYVHLSLSEWGRDGVLKVEVGYRSDYVPHHEWRSKKNGDIPPVDEVVAVMLARVASEKRRSVKCAENEQKKEKTVALLKEKSLGHWGRVHGNDMSLEWDVQTSSDLKCTLLIPQEKMDFFFELFNKVTAQEGLICGKAYKVKANHKFHPEVVAVFKFLGGPRLDVAVLSLPKKPTAGYEEFICVSPEDLEEI
jgi:hypothetical protein